MSVVTQSARRARKRRTDGTGQSPSQVAVGVGVMAGELRAGQAKNVLDLMERRSQRQQVPGDPEIDDAPVRMRVAIVNAPLLDTLGIDARRITSRGLRCQRHLGSETERSRRD